MTRFCTLLTNRILHFNNWQDHVINHLCTLPPPHIILTFLRCCHLRKYHHRNVILYSFLIEKILLFKKCKYNTLSQFFQLEKKTPKIEDINISDVFYRLTLRFPQPHELEYASSSTSYLFLLVFDFSIKIWRLTASEIFHWPLVSQTFREHEIDLRLSDIVSRCSKLFGKYGYYWFIDVECL